MSSHKKLKKFSVVLGVFLAVVIAIGAGCLHLYKQYVNPELIKEKILVDLHERTGGQGQIKDIELKFILQPHVVITGGEMSIPGKLDAKFDTLILYPKLLPLLKGDVKPYYVKLVNPSVKFHMEKDDDEIRVPAAEPFTMAGLKEKVVTVLNFLDTNEKDSKLEIKNGKLSIEKDKTESIYLNRFNAKIEYPDERLNLYISGNSNLSGRIILNGWVNTESFDTQGSLKLINFHPHKVVNLIKPDEDFFVDSNVELNLAFDIKELRVFDVKLSSPTHKITLAKGDEELVVSGRNLDIDLYADEKNLDVKLNRAGLMHPALKANGHFKKDKKSGDLSLSVEANDIEVEPTRKGVLLASGDNRIIDVIFRVVKGGTIPKITLTAGGSSLKNMFHKGNYEVQGTLAQGKISIPWTGMELFDVSGNALVSDGELRGTKLNAKWGNSSGSGGTLLVGTEGPIGPLVLDIDTDAEINDVRPLLERFVKDEGFQQELAQIKNLNGRARGKLHVGEQKKDPKVSFETSSYNLTADYGRVPYPVNISGTDFKYRDKFIEVGDMNAAVGFISAKSLKGSFEWQDTHNLKISSEDLDINLNEFYPWFISHGSLGERLSIIKELTGSLKMSPFSFSGPVLSPPEWVVESSGEITNLSFGLKGLEENVTSERAGFNITPENISFSEAELKTKESAVSLDLSMKDYLGPAIGLELNFRGDVDEHTSNAVSKLVKVPKQISVTGDVTISDSSVKIGPPGRNGAGQTSAPAPAEPPVVPAPKREYELDININADSFEWAEPLEEHNETLEHGAEDKKTPRSPIYGNLAFNSRGFTYAGFDWDSVDGDVEFSGQDINIDIKDAALCGISTPGYFEVTPPLLKLDFNPNSTNEDFNKTLDCLFEKAGFITGEYDFEGDVFSNGGGGGVVESIEGTLKLTSIDGQVHKFGGVAKLLTVLNFGEILRGEGADFAEDGFTYNLITASAEINDGIMNITRAVMDGPSLKIVCTGSVNLIEETLDLELVVIPILAVDAVLDKIPLISQLFGKKSSSVPVKITGHWSDPEISHTSPHALKSGLLTIIKQTLNIPVTLVSPVHSGLEKEKEKEEERRENENGEHEFKHQHEQVQD